MDDRNIERIRQNPAVSAALDELTRAIKTWGVTDNTPRRIFAAEAALIQAIISAAGKE